MATKREAAIRVSLRRNALDSDVRSMESRFKAAGRRMGAALREPISAGLSSARQSISNIGSEIKNTFKVAATLGGAITIGGAARSAMEAQTAYLQLGDALSTFSKQNWEAADAQAMVERVADRTKIPIDSLRTTLLQLSSASGKVDIEKLLERASSQARRLAREGEFIGRVYTRMVAKGVVKSAEEAENLTEQFNTLFRTMLGIDLDESIDPMDVAELAGFINTTGNSAEQMLKVVSLGGKEISKDVGKAGEIVQELGIALHQTKGIDELNKKLRLPKGAINASKTALENMLTLADLGPKKFKKMADSLGGEVAGPGLKKIIGVEFFEGKVSRKKWDLRIEEIKKKLADLSDIAVDRTKLEAADLRHKKTIQSQVNDAMNQLQKAFADKKTQKAISDLSKHLPAMAKGLADLMSWVTDNPWEALATAGGLRIGGSLLGGMAGNALPTLMGKMFNIPALGRYLGGAGAAGSAAAAGRALGSAGGPGGAAVPGGDLGLVFQGISRAGKGTIKGLAKLGAPFAGRSGLAGKAMLAAGGLAAAGAAGYLVGDVLHKNILDPMSKKDFEDWDKAGEVSGSAKRKLKKEETIEEKLGTLKEIRKTREKTAEGPSLYTGVMGTAASWFSDVASPSEQMGQKLGELDKAALGHEMAIRRQMADELESKGQLSKKWNEALFDPLKDLNTIMADFKRTMQDVNREMPKGTSRGPSRVSNPSTPGSEERRG